MKGYYILLVCFIIGSIFSIILSFRWTKKEAVRGTRPSWTISGGNPLINFLLGIVKCMSFKFQKIIVIILSLLNLIFFSLLLFFT